MTRKISALKRKSYFNSSTINGNSSDPYAFLIVIFLKKSVYFSSCSKFKFDLFLKENATSDN